MPEENLKKKKENITQLDATPCKDPAYEKNPVEDTVGLTTEYNHLTAKLRLKLKEFRNQNWLKFLESMGKKPASSVPFWRRINKFRKKTSAKSIPSLLSDGHEFNTDDEKCNLFGNILESTFKTNPLTVLFQMSF